MKALFERLNGDETTPSSRAETEGMEILEKLLAFNTVEDMRSSWLALPQETRESNWLEMMKAAMDSRLESTAMVLEATVERDLTPDWAVTDVFAALVVWHSKRPEGSQQGQQTQLPQLLLHLLRNSPPSRYRFYQWALGQTLADCNPDEVADIYSALQALQHPLHWNTKLRIAGRLTKNTKYKLAALRLFESLFDDPKADIHGRRCAALATELFALPQEWKDRRSPVEVRLLAEAFERVVGRGFSPNIVTYTAMIRALCLTNQLDAAWKIYEVMRNAGTTPDPYVFSVLLNGAKRALSLNSVIRVIEEATPDALQAPYIWNDLVHTILLAALDEAPTFSVGQNPVPVPAFPCMLQVYSKFFDMKPLESLIPGGLGAPASDTADWAWQEKLGPAIDQLPVSTPDKLVDPGLEVLGIMLAGYMRSLSTTESIMAFYSHFRGLLINRDPLAIRLVGHSTRPYDFVLDAISRRTGMLGVAVDITTQMLHDAVQSGAALKRTEAEPNPEKEEPNQSNGDQDEKDAPSTTGTDTPAAAYYHPPPSIFTWTILIQAFCWQAHPKTAIRMIRIMRRHGVQPNHRTWYTLLNSYARRQDVAPVMAVLDQLDQAGYQPNRHTIRAVAKLHGHAAILDRLDERAGLRDKQLWADVEALAAVPPPGPVSGKLRARLLAKRRKMRERWERKNQWEQEQRRQGQGRQGEEGEEGEEWGQSEQGERGKQTEQREWREPREWRQQREWREQRDLLPKDAASARGRRRTPNWWVAKEGLGNRATAGAKEQPAVSDEQLDLYLRMYDDLVFMRTGQEQDNSSEPFVKDDQADKHQKPEGN
jgi:pentatricopeptide repeat protein